MQFSPKPQIPLMKLSDNPSKNYVFNLLRHHIAEINPARALDAGCGDLRNLWMFPGTYVGITAHRFTFELALQREPNPQIIQKRGLPTIYVMRLETEFSFLGAFDLCVSTFTLIYLKDPVHVIARLSERVKQGGALIVQLGPEYHARAMAVLEPHYASVEAVFCGAPELNTFADRSDAQIEELTRAEMAAPNVPGEHAYLYICARGKRAPESPSLAAPAIVQDSGLQVVEMDIPFLDMRACQLPPR